MQAQRLPASPRRRERTWSRGTFCRLCVYVVLLSSPSFTQEVPKVLSPCPWNDQPDSLERTLSMLNRPAERIQCFAYAPRERYGGTLRDQSALPLLNIGLLPLYNSHDAAPDPSACRIARGKMMVQLVEAMKLLVDEAVLRSPLFAKVLVGIEMHDTCGMPAAAYSSTMCQAQANRRCDGCPRYHSNTSSTDPTMRSQRTPYIGVVMGPALSSEVGVVSSALSVLQVPHISYWSTSDDFRWKQEFPYLFRTTAPDFHAAHALTDILRHFGWRYIALINGRDSGRGSDMAAVFRSLAMERESGDSLQACIAVDEQFQRSETEKIRYIIHRLVDTPPAPGLNTPLVVVFIGGYLFVQDLFAELRKMAQEDKEFHRQLSLKHIIWLADDAWLSRAADIIPAPGLCRDQGLCLGRHTVIGPLFRVCDDFLSEAKDFEIRLKRHLDKLTVSKETVRDNPWLGVAWQQQFECCLNFNGKATNCTACETSKTAGQVFTNTMLPPIASGSLWLAAHSALHVLENVVREHEQQPAAALPSGRELRRRLRNVSIVHNGQSKPVFGVDQETVPAFSIHAVMLRNHSTYTLEEIGYWESRGELRAGHVTITWNYTHADATNTHIWPGNASSVPESSCSGPCDGGHVRRARYMDVAISYTLAQCCWVCVPCPDGTYSDSANNTCVTCASGLVPGLNRTHCISQWERFYGYASLAGKLIVTLSCLGIIFTLITAAFLYTYRSTDVVDIANFELSLLTLGILLLGQVTAILHFIEPADLSCSVMFVMRNMVLLMSLVVVLLRSLRLVVECDNSTDIGRGLRFVAQHVAATFPLQIKSALASAGLLLLGFSSAVAFHNVHASSSISSGTSVIQVQVYCQEQEDHTVMANVVRLTLLLLVTCLVMKTRRLRLCCREMKGYSSLPSEAELLCYTIIVLVALHVSVFPIVLALSDDILMVVRALLLNMNHYTILVILFFPRLYAIYSDRKQASRRSSIATGRSRSSSRANIDAGRILALNRRKSKEATKPMEARVACLLPRESPSPGLEAVNAQRSGVSTVDTEAAHDIASTCAPTVLSNCDDDESMNRTWSSSNGHVRRFTIGSEPPSLFLSENSAATSVAVSYTCKSRSYTHLESSV
ncbi:metabotropic glutamate receptor 4-like [Sycon ciliatum]|uniref:metabotropic glutamate receptor 4-like n=1 Tax=Sycon ciliatum TaxID=27933 RepID=UPI0031F6ECA5